MILGLFIWPETAIFNFKAFLLKVFEELFFSLNEYVFSILLTSYSFLFSSFDIASSPVSALGKKDYFLIFF